MITCEYCKRELETATLILDDGTRSEFAVERCNCPEPHCPCCGFLLTFDRGIWRCPDFDCPVGLCAIPIPDVY